MAEPLVGLPGWAAVFLLIFATVSGSTGPWIRENRGPSRIPSQFSEEERVAIKEALKGAIQIPTVSFSQEESNTTALAEFGDYIRKVFPRVFRSSLVQHEVVGKYSYLFTVQGSDPSLQPYMLMAHFDVVPASEEGWEVPPFSGLERNGFIHGRGALDNKNSVMAILHALELLLIRNYSPKRSFFIALGHDEEVFGTKGAQQMAAVLQARGVQLAFLVDEGSFILEDFIPNLKKPVAMISVTEKGAIDLLLQVNMTPGHSSAPPKETSIGILSAALSRLEQTPMPNLFGDGPLKKALKLLADEFSFPTNIVLKNLWLFRPIVSRLLERKPVTNAMVRTTAALTMFNAGVKVNIIPPLAQATVNFRIHTKQSVHEVLELVKSIVADDRVQLRVLRSFEPLPISPSDDQAMGYQLLQQTIQSVFPEVNLVVPGICIANTDSRHYANITDGMYRFNPVPLQPQDFSSIHGLNEKISVHNYQNQVKFIFEFIQNADTYSKPVPHLHEL
ncbi:N-fatty-acyl-amino acid synthase/hydrolase PM20D1 [Arvicanthis niloticus]|uniref:N-fatty-acyl-amino acid synthase/hydrolase PM20D1 n=1 Tax=Arvicanthis niloticus TaxID=61156 RepID=UPI001486EDCB|nr:N-fatty-acyl-amino acid synthase/hydrolase PM20D1 [Arvicanthis niloticus]